MTYKAEIPYGAYWSTPFARWQGSLANLHSVEFAAHVARKELAKDLHYTGDMNDSAKMNIWLHGQVMQKLAANGGKVPADLLKH